MYWTIKAENGVCIERSGRRTALRKTLVFFLAMVLPLTSVSFSAEAAGNKPIGVPLVLKARIEFAASATLTAADVKSAFFPEGRRCAFAYTGPRSNRTIEFMTRMGFRTGVGSGPPGDRKALAARIKATAAKAVGAGTWHTKGGYSSVIQGNTMQETFDAIITSRLHIQKKTDLPVVFCGTGGHIGPSHFPLNRDFDRSVSYGAVYEDAHFLHIATGGPEPYMIYLGFGGERSLTLRGRYNNTMDSRRVPNELVYYQVLAAQFEGTLRRAARGQFVIFSIRDFRNADLKELADNIKDFGGKHPDIWHASPNMVVSNHYLKEKIKVKEVRAAGASAVEITLAVDRNIFVPFVLGPLSLELPGDLLVKAASIDGVPGKVFRKKDGVYVDLPVKAALSRGLAMSFTTAAPDMTVPDTMAVTLKIRNTSDEPLKNARLSWLGSLGLGGGG